MALIDAETLKSNFEGDEDILEELVADFRESKADLIQEVQTAYDAKDFETFERAAHTLKGIISNFFAESLRLQLAALEKMGKEKNVENFDTEIASISKGIDDVLTEVDELIKSVA